MASKSPSPIDDEIVLSFSSFITGRSLIFRYKNQICAKFNDFVNFFAQTNKFSSGSGCQIAKAEIRSF
jgi:hypothetical protein